jgi:cytochrome c-type biogenesis protein CcmH/NrfG
MERDMEEADRVLAACTHDKLDDNGLSGVAGALDGYTVPKSWYAGLIAQARGNEASARAAFEQAKRAVRDDLVQSPNDAKTLAMLALIHAAVGEKNEALGAATRAGELLPIAKDSFDGPILATTLAAVSAKLGKGILLFGNWNRWSVFQMGRLQGTLRVEPGVGFFTRRSAF